MDVRQRLDGFLLARPDTLPLYAPRPSSGRRIEIEDFYLNSQIVTWAGRTFTVPDLELFTLIIKGWMREMMWSKEQALDFYVEMLDF